MYLINHVYCVTAWLEMAFLGTNLKTKAVFFRDGDIPVSHCGVWGLRHHNKPGIPFKGISHKADRGGVTPSFKWNTCPA